MSKASNMAAIASVQPIVRRRTWDELDEVFARNIVVHHRVEGQPPGLDGLKWYWRNFSAAFPDWRSEPVLVFADENFVAFVATLTGTHTGDYLGHAPTGRTFSIDIVQVIRFADDFMVESWGGLETVGVLCALGLDGHR